MSRTIRFVPLLFVLLLFSVASAESVTQLPYELSIMDYTVSGKYTGDIADGKPEGYGIFETVTLDGIACHYIGQWENGLMQGQGAIYWSDGTLEIGEYDKGLFITGQYNHNGLKTLTVKTDDDETLSHNYWFYRITIASAPDQHEPDTIYIGNTNSHVFHKQECDSVRTMKEKNKVVFNSREEATEKGYKPCSRCLP